MNYLALFQRLKLECGVSGSIPSSVLNQQGEMLNLVTWINAAWQDIQNVREDWDWLRTSTSFPTVSGKSQYTIAQANTTNFGYWDKATFRSYETATGLDDEMMMDNITYDEWRDGYLIGSLRNTSTRPYVMAVAPNKSICLAPVPDGNYTITGDYFSAPTDLVNNTDIPAMPVKFHIAIVYRAMMSYGAYESAPEVYQRGEVEYNKILRRMMFDQLPEIRTGSALA